MKMRKRRVLSSTVLLSAALLIFDGCNQAEQSMAWFNENIGKSLGIRLSAVKTQAPPSQKSDPLSPDHRKVNGEFIKELFKVVLRRDVRSEEEFMKYMNALDQGAHYEGLYNGIVYSEEYKKLEKGVASVASLKIYASVMAQLALDQRYDSLRPKPAATPDVPVVKAADALPPQPSEAERLELLGDFERDGITKSLAYLKRRLGEEALKTIELKKEYREKLASWYGRFAVFLNKKGVDFGIIERNSQDEYFHYKWALSANEDRLKWEVINRVHQLMNAEAK